MRAEIKRIMGGGAKFSLSGDVQSIRSGPLAVDVLDPLRHVVARSWSQAETEPMGRYFGGVQ